MLSYDVVGLRSFHTLFPFSYTSPISQAHASVICSITLQKLIFSSSCSTSFSDKAVR